MHIVTINRNDTEKIQQMGEVLQRAFDHESWDDVWDTVEEGIEEAEECLEEGNICLGMVDDDNKLLGWIGGRSEYDGNVWELHPLAVLPEHQKKGIGQALVAALEREVAAQAGLTIYLGSDDTNGMTTLGNVDLYDNLWEKIEQIRNLKNHPFPFYMKLGYKIVGVVPDANGIGRPDIMLAKRVQP